MRRSQEQQINIGEAFAQAMQAYEGGRAGEARKLAHQIIEARPDFGGAHYLLGLLALDQGRAPRAVDHLAKAIAITPGQAVLHLAMGRALDLDDKASEAALHFRMVLSLDPGHAEAHARLAALAARQGRSDNAIEHCRAAVAADPAHAEAWNLLGALVHQRGDAAAAIEPLRRALALRPEWPAALNNFGVALKEVGQLDTAVTILEGAVTLKPGHAGYRANLAAALRAQGRLDAARAEAERATKTDPRNADAWIELGLARQAQGHLEGAAAAFDRAVSVAPAQVHAHYCLAEARRLLGQGDKAASAYRHCLELDPEDRHGAALGLALTGAGPAPDRAPEAYVRQLFDEYAGRFDQALLNRLEYRAPALLADALTRVIGEAHGLAVMDAGCGTGLAAPVLRPRAAVLDGVDLAPAMVEKARARELYDDLAVGELVATLAARPERYDLIVAADVLVYLGNLGPVMQAAHQALHPSGTFAFTVERTDDAETYLLGPKSRYAHAPAYVHGSAEANGFRVALMEEAVTRREAGQDVPGLVVVLTR